MPLSTISPSLVGDNSIADASKQLAGEGIGGSMKEIYDQLFTYDHESGELIWKPRPRDHFANNQVFAAWNNRWAGQKAGSCSRNTETGKYLSLVGFTFDGKRYSLLVHRVIWEMLEGPIPSGIQIDHRDGNNRNNRKHNLRLATGPENSRNRRVSKNNVLRLKGVRFDTTTQMFMSRIQSHGKSIYLGVFPTKGLAAVARAKASLKYHGKFARFT